MDRLVTTRHGGVCVCFPARPADHDNFLRALMDAHVVGRRREKLVSQMVRHVVNSPRKASITERLSIALLSDFKKLMLKQLNSAEIGATRSLMNGRLLTPMCSAPSAKPIQQKALHCAPAAKILLGIEMLRSEAVEDRIR